METFEISSTRIASPYQPNTIMYYCRFPYGKVTGIFKFLISVIDLFMRIKTRKKYLSNVHVYGKPVISSIILILYSDFVFYLISS